MFGKAKEARADAEAEAKFQDITEELGEEGVCELLDRATNYKEAKQPKARYAKTPGNIQQYVIEDKVGYLYSRVKPEALISLLRQVEQAVDDESFVPENLDVDGGKTASLFSIVVKMRSEKQINYIAE